MSSRPPKVPFPPHPFGETHEERIGQWRLMILSGFQNLDPRLLEIRRLALWAADATSDAELARRAVYALGLHGSRVTRENIDLLRSALWDLDNLCQSAHPHPDNPFEDDQLPLASEDSAARRQWDAVVSEGMVQWLYRAVRGGLHGDAKEQRRFLIRIAERDPGLKPALEWALQWKRLPNPHTRGRAGT